MFGNITPDLIVSNIEEIDLDALADRGIEALLVDLDNTICPWHSEDIAPAREDWIQQAKQRFKVCIVSNSINPARLDRVTKRLGIRGVRRWGLGRKPSPGAIKAGLSEVGAEPERAAMIGDQVLADVLGGNRVGLYTVWVQPLQKREFFGTKPARLIEKLLMRRFRRLGLMPEAAE